MNANYAEICRVGKVQADLQQVPLVHFSDIFTQLWNNNNSNSAKKIKTSIFLDKKEKKNHFTIEFA